MRPSVIVGDFDSPQATWAYLQLTAQRRDKLYSWREQYRTLRAYYSNNGLYDSLRLIFAHLGYPIDEVKALRNPAYRVTEFYASKLWPGVLPSALPIVSDNALLSEAIERIWTWSNWSTEKQTFARWFAQTGDAFIKVATRGDGAGGVKSVFMQNIDPENVTRFDVDERGYITMIRLDVPITQEDNLGYRHFTHTEIWDKATQTHSVWLRQGGELDASLKTLGDADEVVAFGEYGIDFVPFVWQPFRAVGAERGMGAYTTALDKIDEANRQATRLSALLFRHNRAVWALAANSLDKDGRPLPPPDFEIDEERGDELDGFGEGELARLPGMSTLLPLVAPINYKDALEVLRDQMGELENDLPELAYYRLRETNQVSGRAVRLMLGDALDRLVEVRANAEYALMRAHQMALTMGVAAGVFETALGSYERGDFDHSFAERDVFPPDEFEVSQTVKMYFDAGVPLVVAAQMSGWSEEQVKQLERELKKEEKRKAELAQTMIDEARRNRDQENAGAEDEEPAPAVGAAQSEAQ